MIKALLVVLLAVGAGLSGCAANPAGKQGGEGAAPQVKEGSVKWAIVIHGGAGTLDRGAPEEELKAYRQGLEHALREGKRRLAAGESGLDVCEAVVRILEDDPLFNAGRGAVFNEKGGHELDASIMDGSTLKCGAVAGVTTVKNPISLARKVMERTRHVLLMGDGAEVFATAMGVERVPNTYFDTERRRKVWEEVMKERAKERTSAPVDAEKSTKFGTVGCVVLDASGKLCAATSTGGLTGKRYGRVGDSPIIGAGNYASGVCAVSCSGTGEEFIRYGVARSIAGRMEWGNQTLQEACEALVFKTLKPDDGGVIAVDAKGNVAMVYSSEGMYRGTADSTGRFDVMIFEK